MAIKKYEERVKALLSEIRKGKKRSDLLTTYGKKWQVSQRTFDRYWQKAFQRFEETERKAKEAADEEYIKAHAEAAKEAVMSRIERMDTLTKIARGQIVLNKPMVVGGKIKNVKAVPDWTDRRNAIAELNKMDGEYAPIKGKMVDDDGKAVKAPAVLIMQAPAGIDYNLPSNTDGNG